MNRKLDLPLFGDDITDSKPEYLKPNQSEPVLNERPIEELFVEKYYGLSPDCDENGKINTDYGDLVNLLTMFKEELQKDWYSVDEINEAFKILIRKPK